MVKSSIFHVTNVPFHVWSSYLNPGWPHTTKPKQTQRKKRSNLRGLLHRTDSHSLNNNNGKKKRRRHVDLDYSLTLHKRHRSLSFVHYTVWKDFFLEQCHLFSPWSPYQRAHIQSEVNTIYLPLSQGLQNPSCGLYGSPHDAGKECTTVFHSSPVHIMI